MEEVEGKTEYIGSKQSEIGHVSATHTDLNCGLSHAQKVTTPRRKQNVLWQQFRVATPKSEIGVQVVPSPYNQFRF